MRNESCYIRRRIAGPIHLSNFFFVDHVWSSPSLKCVKCLTIIRWCYMSTKWAKPSVINLIICIYNNSQAVQIRPEQTNYLPIVNDASNYQTILSVSIFFSLTSVQNCSIFWREKNGLKQLKDSNHTHIAYEYKTLLFVENVKEKNSFSFLWNWNNWPNLRIWNAEAQRTKYVKFQYLFEVSVFEVENET